QLINAIRRDVPRPTVHARNLFHTSLAMWDAWAAYDSVADGYVHAERETADDVEAARAEAISYAAYRVLSHRYGNAVGGPVSQACFDAFMDKLGFDASDTHTEGHEPRALGNRIGEAIIAAFANDGANETANYASPEPVPSGVPNLVVDVPGTKTTDPIRWQRLVIAQAVTQNGIPQGAGAQDYVGPHWGQVTPFGLVRPAPDSAYLDIGAPALSVDDQLIDETVESIRKSAELDIEDDAFIDISAGAYGNNPLASNAGTGHPENPVTHQKYAPERVKRGDFSRVLAEFWADGPRSETPPGHWNVLANGVSDNPLAAHKLFGAGAALDPLAWDVHVYFALNGAVHDAAIAAWELKRKYQTARPITLVRYFGALGQRTDPTLPSYDQRGLPLVDGLIELVTDESSRPGERHAHLRRYIGELAVRSWRGEPGDRAHEHGGIGWVRAVEWMPYQRRTFVTPAFPGYVSGHSTFSRAAATVLATITGDDFFPGGLATFTAKPGYLVFEQGPSAQLELQWGTYYDAADQAGQSRIVGGIHTQRDDFDGRRIGALVGARAIERARPYFDGTASP
ncbi:MAG TPA: vanadium-dependent haloperoxidase, partial [Polyangiaceae bacterium]|nr:vanadium-dependent haloperoxidase [Polyangiaceae bacterium]